MAHFFDTYDRFSRTANVGPPASADRLKYRYEMLFKGREDLFRGKRVIDLGAHDGRWSFCALKAGANFVLGLEARRESIAEGLRNFEHYGVPADSYEFRIGDAFDLLQGLDANNPRYKFDIGLPRLLLPYHPTFRDRCPLQPASLQYCDHRDEHHPE